MVYYYTSTIVDPAAFIYVGKDKGESSFLRDISGTRLTLLADEDLIKFGWEEDVW